MQTQITPGVLSTEEGREAERILRNCVHCGFCTATCPTYQLLGDELDGPRGRIYQIKQLLEGASPSTSLQQHLDRCLLCRSCETTCPSGVAYGRLLETGREYLEKIQPRKPLDRLQRWMLRKILPYPERFGPMMKLARPFKAVLPARLGKSIPAQTTDPGPWPEPRHERRMLILEGCVQPSLSPVINAATARVLDHLGISLSRTPEAGCCGAVNQHLGDPATALEMARRNIDAWWPLLNGGAECIVINASGCGQMVKEYGHLLGSDPEYADKASAVSAATRDLAEVVSGENLTPLVLKKLQDKRPIAYHPPCTLQHGQQLPGIVEGLLTRLGFELTPVENPHLCCGSAGTYSILEPELASRLGRQKVGYLEKNGPKLIATANIGCLNHLDALTELRVMHWIELLDEGLKHP